MTLYKSARIKTPFLLLSLQKLRQIKIRRIDVENVDLVNGIAYIKGKGRDDKEMIYLHPETVKELGICTDKNSTGSGALFRANEAAQETGINSILNNYNF